MALSSRSFGSMVKRTPRYPYYLCPVLWCHTLLTRPRPLTMLLNVMSPLELHCDLRALTKIIPCARVISLPLHVYRTSFQGCYRDKIHNIIHSASVQIVLEYKRNRIHMRR
ncbi:hypothetical protein Hanom_Chr09g00834041 [Helianthus anomalus]